MPADLENSNPSEQRSMAAWLSRMKSTPLSQGEELAKAMQKKVAESNMAQTPPTLGPSKACICAPTNHVGSFRCHLHRTTQKPAEEDKKSSMNFGSKVMVDDGKPRLSRFGKAASARSPQKSESLAVE
ncbi:hypothetical protein HS088_TW06G00430 [Tripterygium wilfordii]|uniref:Serine-rich protein-related n=1 Tax=Tripterygium wilfordii TaxID=458696 RepID=A0A7J7DIR9_TRIWF|nr:uncharacterized protein LOC119999342 [Tripterygium wilfordii]KAF5746260.1 hypothetical protein HS088_TW06G00430 [Tripterygium wilfordii]